jgi:hypothetical protein
VLAPGFNEKLFDESRRVLDVLVNAPRVRAVSTPCRLGAMDVPEEFARVRHIDSVLDCDKDRSCFRL